MIERNPCLLTLGIGLNPTALHSLQPSLICYNERRKTKTFFLCMGGGGRGLSSNCGVVDTGKQFFSGIVDTGDKFFAFWLFLTGINDTREKCYRRCQRHRR